MRNRIKIYIDAEDNLLCEIGKRLIGEFPRKFEIFGKPEKHRNAKSGMVKDVLSWNRAASEKGNARLALIDMDKLAYPHNKRVCPDSEIRRMLRGQNKSPNLLLRIAVFESESWLLADWKRLKRYFKIKTEYFPEKTDELQNSKECLRDIVYKHSPPDKRRRIGGRLIEFARDEWNPRTAAENSKSLRQTLARLKEFNV